MKKLLSILFLIILISNSYSQEAKLDVKISCDNSVKYGQKLILEITLINNSKSNQKFLFDKPKSTTNGPWDTTLNIVDTNTNVSILKYQNKAILSSTAYREEQLKDYYYVLKPGEKISRRFDVLDLVVLDSSNDIINVGTYELQLYFGKNQSNKLNLNVTK
ncbi:MAG: hypothetical protein ACOYBS_05125 [Flavobacterium sp.]